MGIGVQEVPEFIMTSAEASCRAHRTEATHRAISDSRSESHASGLWLWCKRCRAVAMLAPEREKSTMGKLEDLEKLFAGRHFDREVIILCVRWYLRFKLSLRDLVEMMAERGLAMAHTTIMRWVQPSEGAGRLVAEDRGHRQGDGGKRHGLR
jgi:hypothetical protein